MAYLASRSLVRATSTSCSVAQPSRLAFSSTGCVAAETSKRPSGSKRPASISNTPPSFITFRRPKNLPLPSHRKDVDASTSSSSFSSIKPPLGKKVITSLDYVPPPLPEDDALLSPRVLRMKANQLEWNYQLDNLSPEERQQWKLDARIKKKAASLPDEDAKAKYLAGVERQRYLAMLTPSEVARFRLEEATKGMGEKKKEEYVLVEEAKMRTRMMGEGERAAWRAWRAEENARVKESLRVLEEGGEENREDIRRAERDWKVVQWRRLGISLKGTQFAEEAKALDASKEEEAEHTEASKSDP